MLSDLYQNTVLKNPKSIFILLLITLLSFGYFSKDFKLDASSDSLLIQGDPDLVYLNEITERYGSKDFLILTYSPNEGMVTDSSINNLLSLKYKIQSLDWVHSVVTLLDIPLLNNSEAPLQQRLEKFKTLKDEDVDKKRGFQEILNSRNHSKHDSAWFPLGEFNNNINIINIEFYTNFQIVFQNLENLKNNPPIFCL